MSSSPQKRANSADSTPQQQAKKAKTEATQAPTVDDILDGGFDMSFGMPDDNDPLLQVPIIPSRAASNTSSTLNTPQPLNMEIPELPSDMSATFNTTQNTNEATAAPSVQNSATASAAASVPPSSGPQQTQPQPALEQQSTQSKPTEQTTDKPNGEAPKPSAADPDKLSDALAVAGVDLKAEEALLNTASLPTKPGQQTQQTKQLPEIINTPFLDPRQLAMFMNKICTAHGMKPSTAEDTALIQLMTYASEEWMKNILTNAIVLSRHRRRAIKNKRRSELAVALRDLAVQNKTREDQRLERKKNAGITKDDEKEGVEETLHKATNATVAMMTGKKKKYDWMSAGSGGNKNALGDVTTRFREAREEPGIVVRDLLSSLEKKRIGVEKTLAKGYAKLKD